jgi:hypothetical protein
MDEREDYDDREPPSWWMRNVIPMLVIWLALFTFYVAVRLALDLWDVMHPVKENI